MKYFLDTEFNDDGRTIDLISLAMVAEDGRELYCVNADAELHRCNHWVREHVLPQLPPYGDKMWMPRGQIAKHVQGFMFCDTEKPEIWAYYADYDWVAFCQLFGSMVMLPQHLPRYCRDLKQRSDDLALRAELFGTYLPKFPKQEAGEHNALEDARWNRNHDAYLTMFESGLVRS